MVGTGANPALGEPEAYTLRAGLLKKENIKLPKA